MPEGVLGIGERVRCKAHKGRTTQGFVGHCKGFGFYRDGKSSQAGAEE